MNELLIFLFLKVSLFALFSNKIMGGMKFCYIYHFDS